MSSCLILFKYSVLGSFLICLFLSILFIILFSTSTFADAVGIIAGLIIIFLFKDESLIKNVIPSSYYQYKLKNIDSSKMLLNNLETNADIQNE